MMLAAHIRRLFSHTLGTSEGVGRNFMVCHTCGRVVPAWQLVMAKREPDAVVGCKCGSPFVRPLILRAWRSAWWYFAVGVVWRRWIRRQADWDPRLPMRM